MAERIKSMKNTTELIGNLNRNFAACSAVPQPIAPPRTPYSTQEVFRYLHIVFFFERFYRRNELRAFLSDPPFRYGISTDGMWCL